MFARKVGDSDAVLFELLAEGVELRIAPRHLPASIAAGDLQQQTSS